VVIAVDTTRALRRPLDLVGLVEAVVQAKPEDETHWIEWKSDLDLTKAASQIKVAKTILGFANRMPDVAGTVCEGLGYFIVGAGPGHVTGTAPIDGSDLEKGLIRYVAADGPVWAPHPVTVHGKNVLVIVVEAPRYGDRQHTLQRGFEGEIAGTIYVRSQSNTRQANPAEIRLLEDRYARAYKTPELQGLDVTFSMGSPGAIVVLDHTREQEDDWIDARRRAIHRMHQQEIDAYKGDLWLKPKIISETIEEHLELCRERLLDAQREVLIDTEHSLLTMIVTSPGPRIFEHVELTLTIDSQHSAFESGDDSNLKSLPEPPKVERTTLGRIIDPMFPFVGLTSPVMPRMPSRSIDIGPHSITLELGRLRPEKPLEAIDFHLFLHDRPNGGQVPIAWTLTSTSTEGVQRGTTLVPIHPTQGIYLEPDPNPAD
jgi:hypothetical protein